ncbi:hypothetical protein [Pararhodobacter sp.]|uniref:hypothetical protein n=1 Tax=Pararhodobacter sp. TaxID=2127056 RepID=UPI002AFE49C3|nr:hypothetical protein [Pararhodobacter sp.]
MKTLALAAAFASAIALPMAPAVAGSGGQVAINVAPRNAQEAQALRVGLALFALHQDIETNGHVTQHGVNNAAGIYQGGPNNRAIIHQEGRGHDGSISQTGGNNAYGLFQFGQNTSGHVQQTGGQSGLTVLFGW